ncbi:MAG: cytochrome c oxidase subunit 3 [Myxococcota bacterium]
MSAHSAPLPHAYPIDEQFGRATMGKLGMWFFLLSDAFSFSGLLLAYGILRAGTENWICTEAVAAQTGCTIQPELGIGFTAGLTFLLICSSVTMVMSHAALMERDLKGAKKWLALTILGGTLFLCGQAQEYWGVFSFIFHHEGLLAEGLTFTSSHYGTTFYAITGFHGMHVTSGVIYMSILLVRMLRGKYDDGNYNHLEMAGLFWHFVDLVWILVFTLVYLIP